MPVVKVFNLWPRTASSLDQLESDMERAVAADPNLDLKPDDVTVLFMTNQPTKKMGRVVVVEVSALYDHSSAKRARNAVMRNLLCERIGDVMAGYIRRNALPAEKLEIFCVEFNTLHSGKYIIELTATA